VRGRLEVPVDIDEASAKETALNNANVQKYIEGKEIIKFIYVPGRLVNIVIK